MKQKKRILYVFDNINYKNGVQRVTAMQIGSLKDEYDITLFSLVRPTEQVKRLFFDLPVIGQEVWDNMQIYASSLKKVILSNQYNIRQKIKRMLYALSLRLRIHDGFINTLMKKKLYNVLNSYDIVIVLSESSKMRKIVSSLKGPKKIQWIHTDYGSWYRLNDWTKSVSKNDRVIYQKFDLIVTLSKSNKESFLNVFAEFRNKTVVIRNMIPVDEILNNSIMPMPEVEVKPGIKIITISRLEREKELDRLINVCVRLKSEGYVFHWYLVGGGSLYKHINQLLKKLKLEDILILTGEVENPMPLLKKCDLLALLSKYEGMPVTIHEAMVLGVPVIATNVGGISEQIQDGVNGLLVENNESSIFKGLKNILDNPSKLRYFSEQLKNYQYDNESIYRKLKSLLDNVDHGENL